MGRVIEKTKVKCGKNSYPVITGRDIIAKVKDSPAYKSADRVVVCVSEHVLGFHRARIEKAFDPSTHPYFILEDGEKTKSFPRLEPILCGMLEAGLSRHSCVIAIGGGVVGDFAGFAAAVYMRGIQIIHLPTTLLAMVDSSIGGKTAVNIGAGKNIVGAFHQPALVAQDISFIETLDPVEFRNGLSECVKHAFLGDPELLDLIESSTVDEMYAGDSLARLVARASSFKVGIVSRDEKEKGERAILNFGHTVGHAIEGAYDYGIAHGEAVAIGMIIVADICRRLGKLSDDEKERITGLIARLGLAGRRELPPTDEIIREMAFDKKNESGTVRFVLLDGLFHPIYNIGVDMNIVRDAIDAYNGRN